MSRRGWVGIAAAVVISGVLGWALGAHWRHSLAAASERQVLTPKIQAALATAQPSVTVLGDGMVSIHADRTSVASLLQELERQGARLPSAAERSPTRATSLANGEPEAAEPDSTEPARLLNALREGADVDRQVALTRAQELGIDLPTDLLRQMIESDPSESVRVMAFTTFLDTATDDTGSIREMLVSGTYNSSAAVQAEARSRLAEFEHYQEMVAATPSQSDP